MDRACGTDGNQERYIQGFGVETRGKEDHLEDLDIDEMIILRWIFRKWVGGIDWIDLAEDRDRWRAFVNVIMNLRFP